MQWELEHGSILLMYMLFFKPIYYVCGFAVSLEDSEDTVITLIEPGTYPSICTT